MGIIKNIRSIFPLPKAWENDSDRKAFGIRIEQTLRDLFARVSRCVTFTKPTAETTLTSDQKAQARANIGAAGAGDCVYYGTCSTGAATQTKEVTISGFPSALAEGQKVVVKFSNSQQYNGIPKLKINSLDAKDIHQCAGTGAVRYEWYAGSAILFVYDGTQWVMEDSGHATTTYWGRTKLVDDLTSTSTSMALTANQGKVLNDVKADDADVVHFAGEETITGDKTFSGKVYASEIYNNVIFKTSGYLYNQSSTRYSRYMFKNNAGNDGGIVRLDFGNATNQTSNRMVFYEYSPKSTPDTGNTGYCEGYRLPAPNAGLTADKTYEILTTKNAVTVAQGGTGATTLENAQANLGINNKAYRISGIVDHGTTVTLSMESNYGILFIGNTTDYCVAWVYDSVAIKVIDHNSSIITLTKSSNSLKIKNTSSSANYRYYLVC